MFDSDLYIPTYEDMLAAHDRIRPHIRRTPVRVSDYLNELTGAELF
ncbi:MAG: threonine/serine dehydratase, partial [Shimia sp.]|nr:threonine/serine dehydratase [Shimia sp.]MBO6899401.1 threonine/serine dehydratase [Shimia sp.]